MDFTLAGPFGVAEEIAGTFSASKIRIMGVEEEGLIIHVERNKVI